MLLHISVILDNLEKIPSTKILFQFYTQVYQHGMFPAQAGIQRYMNHTRGKMLDPCVRC